MKLEGDDEPLSAADLWQIHGASGTNILAGGWLLIAPWLLDYAQDVIRWNDTITAAVLIIRGAALRAAARPLLDQCDQRLSWSLADRRAFCAALPAHHGAGQ